MAPVPKSLLDHLPLTGSELARRKALAELTPADERCLAALWPALEAELPALVAAHLDRQRAAPEFAAFTAGERAAARIRGEMTDYLMTLFGGRYDERYAEGRLRIGFVHRRIGLAARYFLAALRQVQLDLRAALIACVPDSGEAQRALAALERLVLFDESLILDAFEHRLAAEARREQQRASRYAQRLERQVAARTQELERLTRTDALTGLGNRRALLEDLARELSRARRQHGPLAALYIDIDDFKELNDAGGHARGDEALAAVAGVLRSALREIDIAARIGGDEFCVLLPDTDAAQAEVVAERLRGQVRASCPVSISVGASALEPGDHAEPEALLRRADDAMYRDKRSHGRGRAPPWRLAS